MISAGFLEGSVLIVILRFERIDIFLLVRTLEQLLFRTLGVIMLKRIGRLLIFALIGVVFFFLSQVLG
jgi:hypothetical protein